METRKIGSRILVVYAALVLFAHWFLGEPWGIALFLKALGTVAIVLALFMLKALCSNWLAKPRKKRVIQPLLFSGLMVIGINIGCFLCFLGFYFGLNLSLWVSLLLALVAIIIALIIVMLVRLKPSRG